MRNREIDDTNRARPSRSTWSVFAEVWAEQVPLQGRELFAAQQVAARVDTRFRLRWRADVTPEATRVVDADGRVFDIVSVLELGRREGLEVMATARGEAP